MKAMKSLCAVLIVIACVASLAAKEIVPIKQGAFFSPSDKPTKKLLELIKGAQKSIHMAMYFFTDKVIADALSEAKKTKNIEIKVVVDRITAESKFGKAQYLADRGIKVFVFNPEERGNSERWTDEPIMHNKFVIFDGKTLWTGSFNCTVAACNKNCENVIVLDNQELSEKYEENFIQLLPRCTAYSVAKTSEQHESSLRHDILVLMAKNKDDAGLVSELMQLIQKFGVPGELGA